MKRQFLTTMPDGQCIKGQVNFFLTLTMLWANSAYDKLMTYFLFFLGNKI